MLLLAELAGAHPPEWIGKQRKEVPAARVFNGGGSWKATREKHRPPQRWSVDVERGDDGSVVGTVVINDSPLLDRGRLRGTIRGRQVSGTITSPRGEHAVRFWGMLRGKTLRGTYADRTGESGEWVWDGSLPE